MQAQIAFIPKPIPFLDYFHLEAPSEKLREVIENQNSDEDVQQIIFKILSHLEPKQVARCLNPIQAVKLENYVQARVQKIAQGVNILNRHLDLKSELWTSCSCYQAFKKVSHQLRNVYLSLHGLNAFQARALLVEFSQKEEGKWKALTTKLGKEEIPELPLGEMTAWMRRKETEEGREARLEAMATKSNVTFEQSIPLFVESLNACWEAHQQWLSDRNYAKYTTHKQSMYATLHELASFCTLEELSRHPKISKEAVKWIHKNCIADIIVLMA